MPLYTAQHTPQGTVAVWRGYQRKKVAVAGEFTCAVSMAERQFLYPEAEADLSHHYPRNSLTHVTEVMETYPPVWPASRCTYGPTGHVT